LHVLRKKQLKTCRGLYCKVIHEKSERKKEYEKDRKRSERRIEEDR